MAESALLHAVREGLTAPQKWLPAAMLYDDLGSALFEAITLLPEYEVTRADVRLLEQTGVALGERLRGADVIELGPGGGKKAKLFLERFVQGLAVRFTAIDVSTAALLECQRVVESVRGVTAALVEDRYLAGLQRALSTRRSGVPVVVLFLGSNLSNFERPQAAQFLRDVRASLQPGDAFLLATDLDKAAGQLIPAYDDALGITAAFNKNLLVRLNRELEADFDLRQFRHEARWNVAERRIEMHLVSTADQRVHVGAGSFSAHFALGESLWTESSHRFTTDELRGWGSDAGFSTEAQWVDARWAFAHTLFRVTAKEHT